MNVNHLTHKYSVIYECIYKLELVYVFSPKYILEVEGGGEVLMFPGFYLRTSKGSFL